MSVARLRATDRLGVRAGQPALSKADHLAHHVTADRADLTGRHLCPAAFADVVAQTELVGHFVLQAIQGIVRLWQSRLPPSLRQAYRLPRNFGPARAVYSVPLCPAPHAGNARAGRRLQPAPGMAGLRSAYSSGGGDIMRTAAAGPALGPRFQAGAVVAGVLATFLVSLAAAALLALMVYATSITEQSASALLLVIGLGSLAAGAGYGAHLARGLGWAHGLATGLVYITLSLALSPLLFPGGWSLGGALLRLLLGGAVGTLGGVFGVNL